MMEEYRIQPVTSDERTCDGVYVDSIGAWLGKVLTDETTGQPVTMVEPLLNTTGGRIPAPPNWRNLVIERLPA